MSRNLNTGLLLAVLAVCATASPTRAANLDRALLEKAPDVLKALKDADVKNVGVLPFQVKRGTRPAGYDAAPLGTGLPGRLENALILRQDNTERLAIGIIRDAAGEGGKAGVGPWTRSEKAFKRLFTTSYPLAWGDTKVRPDAFLTGEVRSTGDRSTTEVVLQLITPKSWQGGKVVPNNLVTLKVKTDRPLLRDLGYNFVVSRALVKKAGKKPAADLLDQDAIEAVEQEEKGEKEPPPPSRTQTQSRTPDNIAGMKFEIEYDGVKQKITAEEGSEGSKQPTFQVKAAKPGQKVVMYLTRVLEGGDTLGVVLRLNGRSVFEEQEQEALACKRWVYSPRKVGVREDFAGTYRRSGDKLVPYPFKVLTAAEAKEKFAELGSRAGWIDVEVLAARDATAAKEGDVLISTRSLTRARAKSLGALRRQLAKANNVTLGTTSKSIGGLIVPDIEPGTPIPVGTAAFPNPVHLGGLSIRYIEREGKVLED